MSESILPTQLKQHPFAYSILPKHDEETREFIKQSIALNGQQVKGLVYKGMVLDGMLRQEICYELGIPFKYEIFQGTDLEAKIRVYVSLQSRILTKGQWACYAFEYKDLIKHRRGGIHPKANGKTLQNSSSHIAGKRFKVSLCSIERVTTIFNRNKDLFHSVKNGEMPILHAYRKVIERSQNKIVKTQPNEAKERALDDKINALRSKISIPSPLSDEATVIKFCRDMIKNGFSLQALWIGNKSGVGNLYYANFFTQDEVPKSDLCEGCIGENSFVRSIVCAAVEKLHKSAEPSVDVSHITT